MNPKKPRASCPVCGGEAGKPDSKYCSNSCQQEFQYQDYIVRWLAGKESGNVVGKVAARVRRYLFEKFNSSCELCGWSQVNPVTGKIPLNINHKDGNWRDSSYGNLELLCPNCHSLTPTFGSLNKGNAVGRIRGVRGYGAVA